MVDPETLLEKLRHIRYALSRIAEKVPTSKEALFGNPDTQDVVLRNLQNALQACLDIASHIVADEGWGHPTKATDFFRILGEHRVLSQDLAPTVMRLIRFRNLLVHEYTALDLDKTWTVVTEVRPPIEAFCQAVARWLEQTGQA